MKKATHLIYVSYEPFINKYKEDFYFNAAVQQGFKIEYWNLLPIYQKKLLKSEPLTEGIEKIFNSFKNLKDEILKYKDYALFIIKINYHGRAYKLYRIFSKEKCTTAYFARGALPFSLQPQSIQKKIFSKFGALKDYQYLKKAVLNQLAVIARKKKLIDPFTYVFYAGTESLPVIGYGYKYGLEKSKLIPVNSFDYDKYLQIKNDTERIITESFCVFLDVYLPFHPDFDLIGMPKVDASSYYSSLNNLFDRIENSYKIKVVIAAHPKSNYEGSNLYKNRMVLKNQTAELVRDSDFIIVHSSTSLSFAVLFEKPIIFTYTNSIKEVYRYSQYPLILNFAKILKAPCINIDEKPDEAFTVLPADKSAYNQYKYAYLTNPQSEQKLSEAIFTEFLQEDT